MEQTIYDMIIIGSGPAGLAAAIYGMRADLKLLVLEQNPMSGGQIVDTYEVDNYPGLPGENGFDLAMKFREHADKLGTPFVNAAVSSIEKVAEGEAKDTFLVRTEQETYAAKTVLAATGATHAKLGVPGEAEYGGKGVSYCATCDGAFFRGKDAVVVGGGDVAVEDAIFLARGCRKVYLVHRRDELRATKILQKDLFSKENVEMVWDSVVRRIEGDGKVEKVVTENVKTGETKEIAADACFIAVGILPQTALLKEMGVLEDSGYVRACEDGATEVAGLFVAGDARKKRLRQIVTAVADGANAVTAIQDYLTAGA